MYIQKAWAGLKSCAALPPVCSTALGRAGGPQAGKLLRWCCLDSVESRQGTARMVWAPSQPTQHVRSSSRNSQAWRITARFTYTVNSYQSQSHKPARDHATRRPDSERRLQPAAGHFSSMGTCRCSACTQWALHPRGRQRPAAATGPPPPPLPLPAINASSSAYKAAFLLPACNTCRLCRTRVAW